MAALHFWRAIVELPLLQTDPWYFLGMAELGGVAAALSFWAWCLWRKLA